MIDRRVQPRLNALLQHNPAVALLGPRQSGKTTLALEIAKQRKSVYLDLEDENDRVKLSDPGQYLRDHEDQLVILDEVHRARRYSSRSAASLTGDAAAEKQTDDFFYLDRPQWTCSGNLARP